MNKIQILRCFTGAVIFEVVAADVRAAVVEAVAKRISLRFANLSGANLRGANLSGANLRGANLSGANLRGAYLSDANLSDANLSGANLSGANLRGANLSGAYLRGANLSDANLSDANLSDANLSGANLSGANLSGANLRGANLSGAKNDLWAVLLNAPSEVPALLAALRAGKINGNVYRGDCACLVGTIANARHCGVEALPKAILPDSGRPAERWFMHLSPGMTPANNSVAKITESWIEEFQTLISAATVHVAIPPSSAPESAIETLSRLGEGD